MQVIGAEPDTAVTDMPAATDTAVGIDTVRLTAVVSPSVTTLAPRVPKVSIADLTPRVPKVSNADLAPRVPKVSPADFKADGRRFAAARATKPDENTGGN